VLRVRGSLNATISGKTDQVSLAHNGSRIVGAKRLFLTSTSCVKVFGSNFELSGLALVAKVRVW